MVKKQGGAGIVFWQQIVLGELDKVWEWNGRFGEIVF